MERLVFINTQPLYNPYSDLPLKYHEASCYIALAVYDILLNNSLDYVQKMRRADQYTALVELTVWYLLPR